MNDFLLGMEYDLETTLLVAGGSFILAAILVWLIMAGISRSNLKQLRTKLEKEITLSEEQRMQLGSELNNLQQKNQQTEFKITEQSAQITELEKEKQTAQIETTKIPVLESFLKQKDQEIALLNQRLQESENSRKEIRQEQQSWQSSLAEKDAVVSALAETVKQQAEQVNLSQQYKAELAQTQQEKTGLQQQLDRAFLQLQQLEQQLAEQSVQGVESLEQKKRAELEQSFYNLEQKLLDSEAIVKGLQAELNKKANETAQSKASYNFAEQKSGFESQTEETENKSTELTGLFNGQDNSVEETASLESSLPSNTSKTEIPHEKTKKKSRLMGFFKKLDQQVEKTAPSESLEPSDSKKIEAEKVEIQIEETEKESTGLMDSLRRQSKQTEVVEKEILPEETENKSTGLKGFFKKQAKQTEEKVPMESLESSTLSKTEIQPEKTKKKSSGLAGFFKKLDHLAEK